MVAAMYIRFEVQWQTDIMNLNRDIEFWCERFSARHAKKVVKQYLRLTFHETKHYSLFALTWSGPAFEFINIDHY